MQAKLSIIVASSTNRVIGLNNSLPWNLPPDMARFKQMTTNHTVVMGRRTYDSIGKPLPNRRNIVMTKEGDLSKYINDQVEFCGSVYHLMDLVEDCGDIFIIGGSEIYRLMMPYVSTIYLTQILQDFRGDTFLPEFSENFVLVESSQVYRHETKTGHLDYVFKEFKNTDLCKVW